MFILIAGSNDLRTKTCQHLRRSHAKIYRRRRYVNSAPRRCARPDHLSIYPRISSFKDSALKIKEDVGVNRIYAIEHGKAMLTEKFAGVIAKALRIPVSELLPDATLGSDGAMTGGDPESDLNPFAKGVICGLADALVSASQEVYNELRAIKLELALESEPETKLEEAIFPAMDGVHHLLGFLIRMQSRHYRQSLGPELSILEPVLIDTHNVLLQEKSNLERTVKQLGQIKGTEERGVPHEELSKSRWHLKLMVEQSRVAFNEKAALLEDTIEECRRALVGVGDVRPVPSSQPVVPVLSIERMLERRKQSLGPRLQVLLHQFRSKILDFERGCCVLEDEHFAKSSLRWGELADLSWAVCNLSQEILLKLAAMGRSAETEAAEAMECMDSFISASRPLQAELGTAEAEYSYKIQTTIEHIERRLSELRSISKYGDIREIG